MLLWFSASTFITHLYHLVKQEVKDLWHIWSIWSVRSVRESKRVRSVRESDLCEADRTLKSVRPICEADLWGRSVRPKWEAVRVRSASHAHRPAESPILGAIWLISRLNALPHPVESEVRSASHFGLTDRTLKSVRPICEADLWGPWESEHGLSP